MLSNLGFGISQSPILRSTPLAQSKGEACASEGKLYGPLLHLDHGLTCPSNEGSDLECPFCGNKRDETKRLARRVDGDDVCQLAPPGQGLIACTGSSSKKRGLSFFTGTTGRLEKRVH